MNRVDELELLLAAIQEAPDDDPSPRLVYADAIAERGNEFQGELIVVQHELSIRRSSWTAMFSAEAERLRFRERILLPLVAGATGLPRDALEFDGGFVRKIVTIDRYTDEMSTMVLEHPALRFVKTLKILHAVDSNLPELLQAPFAAGIVRVEGGIGAGHLEQVARVARGIREVRVPIGGMSEILTGILTKIDHVRRTLVRLEIVAGTVIDLVELQKLVLSADLPALRHLAIQRIQSAEPALVELIASSKLLRQLESLEIDVVDTEPATLSRCAGQLEHVRLVHPSFDPRRERPATAFIAAIDLEARGHALVALRRVPEALSLFIDAHRVSSGALITAQDAFDRASTTTKKKKKIDDADPARDREADHVPELLRWSRFARRHADVPRADALLDRVLTAAPEHPGAWGDRAMALVADFDVDGSKPAFARALVYEPEQLGVPPREKDINADDVSSVASALAILADDPEGANELLHAFGWGGLEATDEALHLHAAVVAAFAQSALGNRDGARRTMDAFDKRATHSRSIAVSMLARGFVERDLRWVEESNAIWGKCALLALKSPTPLNISVAMARKKGGLPTSGTSGANPYDLWVCAIASLFASVLARSDKTRERVSLLRSWLADVWPLRPMAAILFRLMLSMSERLMPHVDVKDIQKEIDLLTGSPADDLV